MQAKSEPVQEQAAPWPRERRRAFLRAVHDATRELTDAAGILERLLALLAEALGIDAIVYAEASAGDPRTFSLFRGGRDRPVAQAETVRLGDEFDALLTLMQSGENLVVDDRAADLPLMTAPARARMAVGGAIAAVYVPLVKSERLVATLCVASASPRRWRGDEVALCEELAERVWTSITRARAESEARQRERDQAFLIAWSDSLRRITDPDAIMRGTLEQLGRHLGVMRTTYSEGDEERRVFTTRWDWCDGCDSLVGTRVKMKEVGEDTEREWLAGELVRYDDVQRDPRASQSDLAAYAARHIRAFVSIPLIRDGRVRSILSVQSRDPRGWRDSELRLIRDMGERTWLTLERARAEAELKERERHQALLIAWSDRLHGETSPAAILATTLAMIGQHLGATRASYAEVNRAGDALRVIQVWPEAARGVVGRAYPLSVLGDALLAAHRAGDPIAVEALADDPRVGPTMRALSDERGIAAFLNVPMVLNAEVEAVLSIQQAAPRRWTAGEAQLLRDLADRTWAVLERAQAEQRLAESEASLAAFLENAPLGMHLKDAAGRYLRINPELARQVGAPVEIAIGRAPDEFLPAAAAAELVALERRALAGEVASAELHFPDRTGYADLLAVVFPVDSPGAIARTGGFTLDLTARKAAESALAKSREALYQTEKLSALGSLLAGVSHELNNPLSIVVAQAVMMERQAKGTELAERAFKIRKAADRCARIVQTFLAMARQKQPEREPVDLNAVAAAALELADYGLRTDRIAVTSQFAPGLPPIFADADQLHQIIINLLVNAQQAMVDADGERRLTLSTALGPEPETVILDVADSGPGIPDDIARRIFEPFFTTKPQGEGTGVGLSFSLGLAEAHGGRLALVPQAAGSRFRLTLPIEADRVLPRAAPMAPPEAALPPRRALLIDDEPGIAEVLADFLATDGYACDIAGGGAAALELIGVRRYDLVVSDLRMPGMDGPELFAWIERERPELGERVGFVTGDTLGASVARFLAERQRPVLEKPFTPEAVRRFLQQFAAN